MDRLARAPQDAVDGFDRLARGAQHDERNGVLLGQVSLHCRASAMTVDSSTRIAPLRVREVCANSRKALTGGLVRWRGWVDAAIIRGPFWRPRRPRPRERETHHGQLQDRESTRLNSSHSQNSYAVLCLEKKKHRRP